MGARRLFAVPPGWKPSKKPILVLGVISDTHIRTMPTSGRIDREWSDKYLGVDSAAMSPFNSESFGGYSYSKSGGSSSSGNVDLSGTWQGAFADRLNNWRKI